MPSVGHHASKGTSSFGKIDSFCLEPVMKGDFHPYHYTVLLLWVERLFTLVGILLVSS